MSKMMSDLGRLDRGKSTALGSTRYVPSDSYSYGHMGSKANAADRSRFTAGYNAMYDLSEYESFLNKRFIPPGGPGGGVRNSLYWGPSTDIGEALGSPMRNLGMGLSEMGRFAGLLGLAYMGYEAWAIYNSPVPAGWVIPPGSGWTKCAGPGCAGTITSWDYVAAQSTCAYAPGSCPAGQAWPSGEAPGFPALYPTPPTEWFPVLAPHFLLAGTWTSGPGLGVPSSANRYTLRASFVRAGGTAITALPSYSTSQPLTMPQRLVEAYSEPEPAPTEVPAFGFGFGSDGQSTDIGVGGSGPPVGRPGTYTPSPQDDDKIYMPYSMALKLYHALTEVGDAVTCLYNALTPEGKGHLGGKNVEYNPIRRTPVQQARQVALNLDKLDWAKAAKCLVLNEIEDRAVGKVFGILEKTTKVTGVSTTALTTYMKNIPSSPRMPHVTRG